MKIIRVHKVSNVEDFISQSHLEFLNGCTPSCQFHSMFPIAFKQNEKGDLIASNYMVLMETTKEEMDKLEEYKKQDMDENTITFEVINPDREDQGESTLGYRKGHENE